MFSACLAVRQAQMVLPKHALKKVIYDFDPHSFDQRPKSIFLIRVFQEKTDYNFVQSIKLLNIYLIWFFR